MRTKVRRVNVRNFQKIQEKQVLFQRFVASIVASKSSSLSATQSVSQLVIEPVSQSIGQ